jgi:hypothetical protein
MMKLQQNLICNVRPGNNREYEGSPNWAKLVSYAPAINGECCTGESANEEAADDLPTERGSLSGPKNKYKIESR